MHTLLTSTWKEANLLVRVATILPHPYIPSESTHLLLSFLSICAYPPLPPKLVLNPATVIFKPLSSNVERSLFFTSIMNAADLLANTLSPGEPLLVRVS